MTARAPAVNRLRREGLGISNAGDQSSGQNWADARDLIEPFAHIMRSVPGHDLAIEREDLRFQHPQLGAESSKTRARDFGYAFVTWIGNDIEQLLDAIASDWRDDPKFGEVGADCVDHRRLLADEEMACAMEHQAALLLGRLGLDEPHGRPHHRLANGFRVSSIVLLPLDVGFYVGWRHQAHGVTKRL